MACLRRVRSPNSHLIRELSAENSAAAMPLRCTLGGSPDKNLKI
jgi:hypothetical protein